MDREHTTGDDLWDRDVADVVGHWDRLGGKCVSSASAECRGLGLHALPWLYWARDNSEHRVRKNISMDWEHAKSHRITLPELALEVPEFIQQLPPSDGDENPVRLACDFRSVEEVSSLIRFFMNTPKVGRHCRTWLLCLPEPL